MLLKLFLLINYRLNNQFKMPLLSMDFDGMEMAEIALQDTAVSFIQVLSRMNCCLAISDPILDHDYFM